MVVNSRLTLQSEIIKMETHNSGEKTEKGRPYNIHDLKRERKNRQIIFSMGMKTQDKP